MANPFYQHTCRWRTQISTRSTNGLQVIRFKRKVIRQNYWKNLLTNIKCGNKNTTNTLICSISARNRRKNGGGQSNANGGNDVFNVPKNLDVQLETSSVQVSDLIQLRFYAEYQWLLDFALYAIMVYTLTEVSLYQKKNMQNNNHVITTHKGDR